jgi:DNA-binding GntR family transcriptional regulator
MAIQAARKSASAENKAAQAYRRLRALILNGEFQNGQRLVEAKLAKTLGMSRGPIRESLLRLESEGLLRSRGTYRSRHIIVDENVDVDDFLSRYELREQIESGAARLAAKNMTGWQIDHLRQLAEAAERASACEALTPQDQLARYEAAERFHDYLVQNCGNTFFVQIYERFRLMPARPASAEIDALIRKELPDQEDKPTLPDVAAAIAAHDQDLAERLVKQRVRTITAALRKVKWTEHFDSTAQSVSTGQRKEIAHENY